MNNKFRLFFSRSSAEGVASLHINPMSIIPIYDALFQTRGTKSNFSTNLDFYTLTIFPLTLKMDKQLSVIQCIISWVKLIFTSLWIDNDITFAIAVFSMTTDLDASNLSFNSGGLLKFFLEFLCTVASNCFTAENILSCRNALSLISPSVWAVSKSSISFSEATCPDCSVLKIGLAGSKGSQSNSLMHSSESCTHFSSTLRRYLEFSLCKDVECFKFAWVCSAVQIRLTELAFIVWESNITSFFRMDFQPAFILEPLFIVISIHKSREVDKNMTFLLCFVQTIHLPWTCLFLLGDSSFQRNIQQATYHIYFGHIWLTMATSDV